MMRLSEPLVIEGIGFTGTWRGRNCKIGRNTLTIYSGFDFNGMTWGSNGERDENGKPYSWKATAVHDCLYGEKALPLSRRKVDKLFLVELRKINFKHAYLYYLAVRFGGWVVWYLNK